MNAKQLKEQRAEIYARMQALVAEVKDGVMTAEQSEQYDRMDKEQSELQARAETAERIEKLNGISIIKEAPVAKATFISEQDSNNAIRAWALNAAGYPNLVRPEWRTSFDKCGLGGNALNLRLEARAQSKTVAEGGYTVGGNIIMGIEKALKDYSGARQACRVVRTENGQPLAWATNDDTSNVGAIVAENTETTNTATTFGQVVLGAYKFTSLIQPVSMELLQDSGVDIGSYLAEILGERLARAQNTYFTMGTGSSQPQGVAYASTKGVDATATDEVTAEELIDLMHSVDVAYRSSPNCKWMMNDSTYAAIRKLTDDNGQFLWGPGLNGVPQDNLLGKPVVVNNDVPALAASKKAVIFGDFSKHLIRDVMDIQVRVLNERYVEYGSVGFIAFARSDSKLLNTAAVKHILTHA